MTAHFLTSAAAAILFASTASAQVIYADANLTTGANDGSSWANAFQGTGAVQDALNIVAAGEDIYAADGLYITSTTTGERALSFRLRTGVTLFGGFAGGEASPDERPPFGTAVSILSADQQNDDSSGGTTADNSYHVVRAQNTDETAVLDGFTCTGGNANVTAGNNNDRGGGIICLNGQSPTIRNCVFIGNSCVFGGGAGYVNNAAPRFENCSFIDNQGGAFGGAFDIAGGNNTAFDGCYFEGNEASRAGALEIFMTNNASVANSVFIGNRATGTAGGGAFWLGSGGSTSITNCTIVGNFASSQNQGGIRNQGAVVTAMNCILWGNQGPNGAQAAINQANATANLNYSIVEGGFVGTGTGNLATDPNFMDLAGGDLRLALPSPAVDAGNGNAVPAGSIGDFAGARRIVDEPGTANSGLGDPVDIGAFEFTTNIGAIFCNPVNINSTGVSSRLDAQGSTSVAANDLTLSASQLPLNVFGFMIASRDRGFVANPAGSAGNLCLSGSIGRYVGPGQIQSTGATGGFSLTIDTTAIAQPTGSVPAEAGTSWSFQAWHRDTVGGTPTSNFTDGVRITFDS